MSNPGSETPAALGPVSLASLASHRYFALMRYALVNFVAIALLVSATLQGWIGQIYEADVTRLTTVIALTFVLGLILASHLIWRSERRLDQCAAGRWPRDSISQSFFHAARDGTAMTRSIQVTNLRIRLMGEISLVRYLANTLVVLGLIGTVIGFIIALSSVDPEIAVNPSAVSPMVANLIEGMSVALYTTLVGAVLSVWLGLCYQLLSSSVREFHTALVDLGEQLAAQSGTTTDGSPSVMEDDDPGTTVFRDMTLLALVGVMTIVMLLLPWLNPKGSQEQSVSPPGGSVIVELFWPDDVDADVDLWVQAPEDGPVGYSSMAGLFFNLLRDDLGARRDATPINYEIAYTRGISPGEHIANIHLYRSAPGQGNLPVTVAVSAVEIGHRSRKQLFQRDYVLRHHGQEITAARFTIDAQGKLVPGSVNNLQRSLLNPMRRRVEALPEPDAQ